MRERTNTRAVNGVCPLDRKIVNYYSRSCGIVTYEYHETSCPTRRASLEIMIINDRQFTSLRPTYQTPCFVLITFVRSYRSGNKDNAICIFLDRNGQRCNRLDYNNYPSCLLQCIFWSVYLITKIANGWGISHEQLTSSGGRSLDNKTISHIEKRN